MDCCRLRYVKEDKFAKEKSSILVFDTVLVLKEMALITHATTFMYSEHIIISSFILQRSQISSLWKSILAELQKEEVHTDPGQNIRDIAGEYTLLSNDFIYLGRDAVDIDIVSEKNALTRETKYYKGEEAERIIQACISCKDGKVHLPHEPFAKGGGCC